MTIQVMGGIGSRIDGTLVPGAQSASWGWVHRLLSQPLATSPVVDLSTTGVDLREFGGDSLDRAANQRTSGNGMDR